MSHCLLITPHIWALLRGKLLRLKTCATPTSTCSSWWDRQALPWARGVFSRDRWYELRRAPTAMPVFPETKFRASLRVHPFSRVENT